MLTSRGWWFVIVVILQLVLGVLILPNYTVVPAVLGLTLLAWFAWEWVQFRFRMNAAATHLKLSRRIIQGGRDVPMVWAGLPFQVRLRIEHNGFARIPFAALEDRLPQASGREAGSNAVTAELPPNDPVEIAYTLNCPSPGVLRFEGVRTRIVDLLGFFYHRGFLRDAAEYLILPPLADDEGKQRADKRFNTLPPPGIHRFRRPGTSSELLDLRDYQPGDPPKMIAWKPSARRDKLITKEYESDVPVRTVLFLDTSESMRLGPPGYTPLTRMSSVASVVSQAAAGNRDLVGLTTFDEHESKGTNPARTKLHLINLLRRLAEVSVLQPGTKDVPAENLTRRAYPLAMELYPELMDRRINTMPLGRLWLPLLDKWWGWIFFWIILLTPLLIFWPAWLGTMIEQAVRLTPRTWHWMGRLIAATILLALFVYLPAALSLAFWGIYGVRGWFGTRKDQLTKRKRLAALFALHDGTGAAGIERLIHDDSAYGERIGRFLQLHQIRMPVPLYDEQGRYRFRCPGKAIVLAHAIVRAVSRARDNELFVLLADLSELGTDIEPILKAARVARARKHQLLVLVPWPADVPPPEDAKPAPTTQREKQVVDPPHRPFHDTATDRKRSSPIQSLVTMPVVQATLIRQYHEAFRQLRRAFGRVGATVVRVNADDPVRMVLDRLDRMRGMRSRR